MGVFKAGAALASSWTTTKPKPDRPELKSLQLAAAAAKKDIQEQDERDRKATLKEERRLLAAEKKQAEEKAKAENERKARMAEVEKKKQEREEALKERTTFKVKVPTNHAPPSSSGGVPPDKLVQNPARREGFLPASWFESQLVGRNPFRQAGMYTGSPGGVPPGGVTSASLGQGGPMPGSYGTAWRAGTHANLQGIPPAGEWRACLHAILQWRAGAHANLQLACRLACAMGVGVRLSTPNIYI
ncbi:uncharacterized protein PGTG_16133 [Puccinia graminis f. sp. tritici CRL 75-36-700-3]|uniref:ATP-dependent DNA helicase sgs1 n=1 Tax=Puccinia graminis f. sp. tritici (strain CRL 75-36-700-3 / race SCCL) TaxID=418459 RepID=E3L1E8_PUCGT|nr:uncharacterized protein PGTG_16133 [Puccinia graminis f. sp. tritici CRL 75-36-700-3]EFP90373.2 hypothetical protein PGTG_16133 [Puccinia graminis f. sp. tritici CRL 75-36-700-3]